MHSAPLATISNADEECSPKPFNKRLGMSQACAAHKLARDLEMATRLDETRPIEPAFSPSVMMVEGMRPASDAEAIIAAQLVALNCLMLEAVGHARRSQNGNGTLLWTNEAVKTSKASALLADTLARMQRGGEQRVIVQRVNVGAGGQAIVGAVDGGRGR